MSFALPNSPEGLISCRGRRYHQTDLGLVEEAGFHPGSSGGGNAQQPQAVGARARAAAAGLDPKEVVEEGADKVEVQEPRAVGAGPLSLGSEHEERKYGQPVDYV